jgi:C-terminal processing protease CtpA/Prc
MIVDLRMNGGGEPTGVATMASYFLDDRTHINDYYDRKTGATEQSWTLDHLAGPRYGASRPLYILTSARTFSAAEEFAYDMKVLKRAVIIGEPTGGGAHPGDVYRLSEHFKMFIPTGRSINPVTKTDWDRVGVTPDVSISQEKALDAAQVAILKILIDASQDAGNKASLKQKLQLLESGNADKGPVHQ